MKKVILIVVAALLIPCPSLLFGIQDVFDTLQDKHLLSDGKNTTLDVPYVQTESYIVQEMLSLLDLQGSDVLYDLGCGDGRIVIEAVKKKGVRGVGVDIDPRRIAESRANANAARVDHRTLFLQQDIFTSDFRDATALTLFLLPELNLRLRPKLFRDLKPGTRIVSHNFNMGDWEPDRTAFAGVWEDGPRYIYFWVLPANISGRWQGSYKRDEWTLTIRQRFQKVDGSLLVSGRPRLTLSDMTLKGNIVRFVARSKDQDRMIVFEGRAAGDIMEGIAKEGDASGAAWKARRDPATKVPIE